MCLDVAIAGAVTAYQSVREQEARSREVKHLGYLAHELRNALTSASIAEQLIKKGTVGVAGSTANMLGRSLKRMGDLIDRSLTEVRLRVDPQIHVKPERLLLIVDEILVSAGVEAQSKHQTVEVQVDPTLVVLVDQQAFHAALSNLIQNALKFTAAGGKVQVRSLVVGENVLVEVEDQCGGLEPKTEGALFDAFEQRHEDRSGLGLGLTIARKAVALHKGTLEVRNLPGTGCVFTITLPREAQDAEAHRVQPS